MQRETKDITTSRGVKVTIKTYLTAREANTIKEDMYASMKFDPATGTTEAKGGSIDGSLVLSQERKLLGIIVTSLEGSADNIPERLLDLRDSDYQEIVYEVNAVSSANLTPAK